MNMKKAITLYLLIILASVANAQVSKTQVLMVNATVQSDGITLNWPAQSFSGSFYIFRKSTVDYKAWGNAISTLNSAATSYKDVSATPGKSYEYWIVQVDANGTTLIAQSYLYVGNAMKEVIYKGGIVLVVDSNYIAPLASEINRLAADLTAEGWVVSKIYAGRKETPVTVKARLKQHISTRKAVSTVLIIGHVPVPYSGGFTGDGSNWPPPDGHVEGSGDHTGAWPADGYYGDMDYTWTDQTITLVSGADTRNHNVPGDGKFDPTKFPSTIELEVGRIDLYNMPVFGVSDTILMRNYLNRNHLWRTGQTHSIERGLVDDNFTGFNLASSGWHCFSAFFPKDSVKDNVDYVAELKSRSYLWSCGSGPGSYTSCGGVASTSNFATDSLRHTFTMLTGSFFGDWDVSNSLLRAPLGRSALASFWGGIPKWYVHTMGLGKHIGYGTRVTMNNRLLYFNGAFNSSDSSVHIALMGDPTLCNRHLPPVKNVTAASSKNLVKVKWSKSIGGPFDGYVVYRVDTTTGTYIRVSKYLVTDTSYNDSNNFFTGHYRYEVRTIKKEITASGSYYNVGGGAYADLYHVNGISKVTSPSFKVYPNPTTGIINLGQEGLHSFEIYNALGQSMLLNAVPDATQVDISELPAGAYILRCYDAQGLEVSIPVIKS